MNADRIREIEQRLEAATPGPWELWTGCSWRRFGSKVTGSTVCEPTKAYDEHPDLYFRNGGEDGPDAQLIAHAPQDIRSLLSYVKELEAERDLLLGVASDEWYNNGNEGARRMLRDLNDLRIENKRPQLEEFGFLEPERSIYPYSGISNPNAGVVKAETGE